jgi:protein O-mannosyl-transferase
MKQKRIFYLLAVILVVAVTMTYSNHFHNGFHFDDAHTIVENIYIKDIRNVPLFFKDATTFSSLPTNQSYRPVVSTSIALDHWLSGGLHPFHFHLSTFVLFLVQGLLMYLLYVKVFDKSYRQNTNHFLALFSTAWYLLHPANAETVNYIIARSDSLSTQFLLFALVLFLYSTFCRKWQLYLIPLGIGLLAKPTAGVFPLLLWAYVLLFEKKLALTRPARKENLAALGSSLRLVLPSFLFTGLLLFFVRTMDPPTLTPGGSSLFHYVITQPYVALHYFTTFFLPTSLSADADWVPLTTPVDIRFFLGLSFVLALLIIAFVASKKEEMRPLSFGILWFLIALLPTSVLPLAEVMNDHRMFFPFVGLAMGVPWAVARGCSRVKGRMGVGRAVTCLFVATALVALGVYAYGAHQRNEVWRTEETLWRDVTEKSPGNGRGWMNYGLALMARADYEDAERCFARAMGITPNYPYLLINMGVLKEAVGKPAESEAYLRRALVLGPNYPECHYYYARFLNNRGRMDEAVRHLNRALELSSAHLRARHLLMEVYLGQADYQRLDELVERTLMIAPGDRTSAFYLDLLEGGRIGLHRMEKFAEQNRTPENLLELSLRYYEAGQYRGCIEAAKEAMKLRPDWDPAYNNICAAHNRMKEWDQAIQACERAVGLNPGNELARNNLAWARGQKNASGQR